MRESEIRMMQAVNAKRAGLLLDQFVFLETRQRALEEVLCGLTLTSRIKLLFNPKDLKQIVDKIHTEYLNDAIKAREDAMKRAKEEAAKPKITIVGANGVAHA